MPATPSPYPSTRQPNPPHALVQVRLLALCLLIAFSLTDPPVCSELNNPPLYTIDKTAFSMLVPELRYTLAERSQMPYQIAIAGIETHICVTQTALDLLSEGHRVYVLTDGVSSCNGGERGVALSRLR